MVHDRHHRPDFQVELSVLEMALLVSALFMTEHYTPISKRSVFQNARKWERKVSMKFTTRLRRVRARAMASRDAAGDPIVASSFEVHEAVPFSNVERALMIRALRQCHVEFEEPIDWGEFCVAGPGALSALGGAPDDLLALATMLESARTPPPSRSVRTTKP